jgi:hypothetical protein
MLHLTVTRQAWSCLPLQLPLPLPLPLPKNKYAELGAAANGVRGCCESAGWAAVCAQSKSNAAAAAADIRGMALRTCIVPDKCSRMHDVAACLSTTVDGGCQQLSGTSENCMSVHKKNKYPLDEFTGCGQAADVVCTCDCGWDRSCTNCLRYVRQNVLTTHHAAAGCLVGGRGCCGLQQRHVARGGDLCGRCRGDNRAACQVRWHIQHQSLYLW